MHGGTCFLHLLQLSSLNMEFGLVESPMGPEVQLHVAHGGRMLPSTTHTYMRVRTDDMMMKTKVEYTALEAMVER